ncbi:hypothetical protein JD844_029164 [Phrynosoma platyrhinos]|uniref:TNase-like domain-containing protein n=1 Tax=Phrynosoma platyrhinos TaxID=52577 RepID=A0ABQ7SIW6_PHRPL|nr:hypothetical protein JD844_029164 [Phrynosoma platyrhinos]
MASSSGPAASVSSAASSASGSGSGSGSAAPALQRGIVKMVLSGCAIIVRGQPRGGPPPERQINLSNIRAGNLARRAAAGQPDGKDTPDEPWGFPAREFLRKKLIGKEVCFTVEYKTAQGREYGMVYLGKVSQQRRMRHRHVLYGLYLPPIPPERRPLRLAHLLRCWMSVGSCASVGFSLLPSATVWVSTLWSDPSLAEGSLRVNSAGSPPEAGDVLATFPSSFLCPPLSPLQLGRILLPSATSGFRQSGRSASAATANLLPQPPAAVDLSYCLSWMPDTTGENIAESLVMEGLASRREGIRANNPEQSRLAELEEQARIAKKGMWSDGTGSHTVRDLKYTIENPRHFVDSMHQKPVNAIIEHVRDGSVVRALLLPDYYLVTVMLSGIKCPTFKREADGTETPEPFAAEAKFYTESRLLQRDVQIILESCHNQNILGTILHPASDNGNITELLLKEGFARCVDWSIAVYTRGAEKLRAAERYAKEHKLRIWRDYVAPTANLDQKDKQFVAKVAAAPPPPFANQCSEGYSNSCLRFEQKVLK